MNHGQNLRGLLEPLGVYRWEGSFQWGELQAEGAALDGVAEHLAWTQREMNLVTAQGEGLSYLQELLGSRTASRDLEDLRLALAALLRVEGGGFTLAAMNDTLRGCGIQAQVTETGDPLRVVVTFPGTGGVPGDLQELQRIVEGLLPCHLHADYRFTAILWEQLEGQFASWDALEGEEMDWNGLEAIST